MLFERDFEINVNETVIHKFGILIILYNFEFDVYGLAA